MNEDRPFDARDATELTDPAALSLPEKIGPYRILQRLGEGGMGEVFEAEQLDPVRRRVALKLIKPGMDSKQVVARFESERQALALMNHPNIARVLDAGVSHGGRPYFVMERVKGISITQYCDLNRLSTGQRLELFNQICDGVQHAHQKGIIHRDIKPGNVLIALQDDEPIPKIIDFGVAKAIDHRLTERTMFTQLGQLVGTPEYMSPEQAEVTGLDVDTRTDVYSLGVLLYELLVGALPFDARELRKAGVDSFRRKVVEIEPPKPSTRLASLGDTSAAAATKRRTDTTALARQLRGDLDWITMKALEKDRTRRYGSASDLAADVARHLNHEPVLARPPSRLYRAGKFVRRHKMGVAFTLVLVLLLMGTSTGMTFLAFQRAQERDRANQEAESVREIADFMVGLFEVADPSEARGKEVTAKEILDAGAEGIAAELADQPSVMARLMGTMGQSYHGLGLYERAQHLAQDAVDTRTRWPGPDLDLADSKSILGGILMSRARYDEARVQFEDVLAIRERELGPDNVGVAAALHNLARALRRLKRNDEALRAAQRSLEIRQRVLDPDHQEVRDSLNGLANVYYDKGNYDAAREQYERVVEVWERVDPNGLDHAKALQNLAAVHQVKEEYATARELYGRALDTSKAILGDHHPEVADIRNNFAGFLTKTRDYEGALRMYEQVLAIRESSLRSDHPDLVDTLNDLANVLRRTGDLDGARKRLERAKKIMESGSPDDDPVFATILNSLANLYGDDREAIQLYRQALSIQERVFTLNHDRLGPTLNNLGEAHYRLKEHQKARQYFERAVVIRRESRPKHADLAASLEGLARALHKLGDDREAAACSTEALQIRRELHGTS